MISCDSFLFVQNEPAVWVCVPCLFLNIEAACWGYRPNDAGHARRQMKHFKRVLARIVSVIK